MFWKRKARLTFPDVPPSLKTYPAVVRAVELGKRLAALCSEGTPQEVKAAYPDDKRQELIDLIDDDPTRSPSSAKATPTSPRTSTPSPACSPSSSSISTAFETTQSFSTSQTVTTGVTYLSTSGAGTREPV